MRGDRPFGRVAIVEANGGGHRLGYVRLLVEAAIGAGWRVRLFLPSDWVQLPEAAMLGSLPGEVEIESIALLRASPDKALESCDRIVIPDGDLHLASRELRAWARRVRITLLVMRGRPEADDIRSRLRFLVKRALMGWFRLRGHRVLVLCSFFTPAGLRGRHAVPDPVVLHSRSSGERRVSTDLDLVPGRYWIGVVGGIDRRKNLDLLTEALAGCPTQARLVGVVLVGQVRPDYLREAATLIARLEGAGVDVRFRPGFTTNEYLDAVLESLDAVVVAYSNRGPSGIAARAAALGTLVLAAGSPTLAEDARMAPGNVLWEPLTAAGLRALIQRAMDCPAVVPLPAGSEEFTGCLLSGI